jgi:glycerophosphoryl diester phosphodiesterase
MLEQQVVKAVKTAGLNARTRVRSFDHRSMRAMQRLEPRLPTSILILGTAPVAPGQLARVAGAQAYCPEFEALDARQVKQCHAEGVSVIPWTVNEPADWQRLLDWGVDGITTDYPDQLARFLDKRGVEY